MSAIKAICFDLDGVFFTPEGKKSFDRALIEEYGTTPEMVRSFMYRIDGGPMQDFVCGKISGEEFFQAMRAALGIQASDEELTARWVRDYEVDPDVARAVLRAKELGLKTCTCTNNNAVRLPILVERFDLKKYFDVIISAHEVGFPKPDMRIYQALIDALDVHLDELIYSDDNPARIQGAEELGIRTFVYENFPQFLQELKELGVDLS